MEIIKKKILFSMALLSFLGLTVAYGVMLKIDQIQPTQALARAMPTIVIDAGHGGMDGGAVGIHKELEKDINLTIAKMLNLMLKLGGYQTVMVRESDISVHDPYYTSAHSQKVSDIKNRLQLAEDTPNAIFISVHQNLFEQKSCCGAQIFYSRNHPESARLATVLKCQFQVLLQPQNKRETKPAQKNLYILSHATCPAVLVECGFLSNHEEATLLSSKEYQQKVAFTIYTAIQKYQEDELQKRLSIKQEEPYAGNYES